jgi:hypothetical protein
MAELYFSLWRSSGSKLTFIHTVFASVCATGSYLRSNIGRKDRRIDKEEEMSGNGYENIIRKRT